MKLKINERRFKGAIRLHTQTAIAKAMGIAQPSIAKKIKNLEIMRFSDFNRICEIIDEDPREFLVFEDDEYRSFWQMIERR